MHDPYFDHRLDPKPIPLAPSTGARVLGALLLGVATIAPLVFVASLVSAVGAWGA